MPVRFLKVLDVESDFEYKGKLMWQMIPLELLLVLIMIVQTFLLFCNENSRSFYISLALRQILTDDIYLQVKVSLSKYIRYPMECAQFNTAIFCSSSLSNCHHQSFLPG